MIFFYLLIFVMPLVRDAFWTDFVGGLTIIKYLGLICVGYGVLHYLSRPTRPRFFGTWQARWFVVLSLFAMTSYVFLAIPQPIEFNPFLSYLSFLVLFFVTLAVVDSLERLRYVLLAAVGSVGYASLHALREWQKYGGMEAGYRPGWISGDPNYYSASALLCLPLAFYLLRTTQPRWERRFCLGAIVVTLFGLMLAASRGALVGLVAESLVAIGQSQRRARNFLLLFVILVPLMGIAPSSPLDRLLSPNHSDQESADRRVALWEAGLRLIQDHPLFGIGVGNFKPLSGNLRGVAHNTFLEIATELGIAGLALFAAMLVSSARTLTAIRRATRDSGPALVYHASGGMQSGLTGGLVALLFLSAESLKLFWLMIFLTMCLEAIVSEAVNDSALC